MMSHVNNLITEAWKKICLRDGFHVRWIFDETYDNVDHPILPLDCARGFHRTALPGNTNNIIQTTPHDKGTMSQTSDNAFTTAEPPEGGEGAHLRPSKKPKRTNDESPATNNQVIDVDSQNIQHGVILTPGQMETTERSKALGISSPKRVKGHDKHEIAEKSDIDLAVRNDGFGRYIGSDTDEERILMGIYGRDYFLYDEERRKREVKMMLEPGSKVCERALRFVQSEGDNYQSPQYKANRQHWMEVAMAYGKGEDEHGYNCFVDFGSKWIQRVQPAGSCFLHAPVVLQSYLLQGEQDVQAIDISKYARESFGSEDVSRFIVTDAGGNSFEELLKMLLVPETRTLFSEEGRLFGESQEKCCVDNCACFLEHQLRTKGPALVRHFLVDDAFQNYAPTFDEEGKMMDLPCLRGKVASEESQEHHAMVLVGLRKVGEEWRLLLQNWWPHSQLVEMSAEYFLSSKARIVLVGYPQHGIPQKFERCNEEYAEANMGGRDNLEGSILEK